MKKQYILFLFLMLSIGINAQERIAKGYVYNKDVEAVAGAKIRLVETQITATSNEDGEFAIEIPEGYNHIIISKENYYTLNYILNDDFQKELTIIYIESIKEVDTQGAELAQKDTRHFDSIFLNYKNSVSLSLLELFSVAIAIRYERFLSPKHAIGLHASYYILGQSTFEPYYLYNGTPYGATYTGFKAVPFYRFYPVRTQTSGFFIDAKIPFGYFDFNYVDYYYSPGYVSYETPFNFWTLGGGLSIGVMTRLPKTKHGVLNLSLGYQYFPIPEPDKYVTTANGATRYYSSDTDWWYKRGPGGRFDLKLTIGGIF